MRREKTGIIPLCSSKVQLTVHGPFCSRGKVCAAREIKVHEIMSGPSVPHSNNHKVLEETTANCFIPTNVQITCATVVPQQGNKTRGQAMLRALHTDLLLHHADELPRPVHGFPASGTRCTAAAGFLRRRPLPFSTEIIAFPSTCSCLR